jgi:hypothetical protein
MNFLQNPAVPNFPLSPIEWDSRYHDQFLNVLRLFLTQVSNRNQSLFGSDGGKFLGFPCGAFLDTTDQIAANTTTAYPIILNTTAVTNQIFVTNNSQIFFESAGIYNVQVSLQLVNYSSAAQDIDVWFKMNDLNINKSNNRFGLSARKAVSDPFHLIGYINFVVDVQKNDYVQVMWRTSHVDAYLEHYGAPSSPSRPEIPSAVITVSFLSSN